MVLLPFGYFTEIQPINIGLLVLMSFVGMGRALYLLRSGEAGSGMLLVATIMSILGVLFANIVFLGISPASFVLLHAWNIGLFGNIIALHLAIGARTQEQERLRHEAEQQARRAEHRATREERARKEHEHFISMVTHELKSPLATIVSAQNSLEILLDKPAPEVETRLERIRRATRRIDTIAERYLREDRQAQPEIHPRFASHALQQVLAMACGHFTGDKARLQVESATDAQLYCDAELLATALLNLMDNAVKYSDGPVSVSASLFQGREVMIDVADRGPGVPDPIRAAIFERYFRAPETADSPGIGLGLSLVKKIVEVHEGTIEVLDREGGGAVFRMVLPICRPER
jgi:signal transduction histidine kinase